MSETTFLQIQGRDQSASRVLELPLGPVRIGRGSHCEVRLGGEPGLGDVQCLLRRRGTNWHFQPVGPPGHVWIDGRPADQQRPLPVGSSLRVGDHWLTLRSATSPPDARGSFAAPISVEPRQADEPTIEVPPVHEEQAESAVGAPSERTRPASTLADDEDRLRRWQNRLEQRERWLKSRQEERTWEARWKAAGETIRGRGTSAPAPPNRPATPPTSAPPLERRTPARPAERTVEPRSAAPLRRPTEPTRSPVPQRIPVRPTPTPTTVAPISRPRPEPSLPTTRALVTIPAGDDKTKPPVVETAQEPTPVIETIVETSPELRSIEVPADLEVSPTALVPALAPESIASETVVEAELAPIIPEVEPTPDLVVEAEASVIEPSTIAEPEDFPGEVIESDFATEEAVDAESIADPVETLPAIAGPGLAPPAPAREAGAASADWPSAQSIFGATVTRAVVDHAPVAGRRPKLGPTPTAVVAPAQWTLPLWLGWLPTTAAALVAGTLGIGLAWTWTWDAMGMSDAVRLALRPEKSAPPAIDPTLIPRHAWWQTTSGQLAAWAVALERSADGEERAAEVRSLVEDARHAAPLSANSRFVVELEPNPESSAEPTAVAVGRTRDLVALAWTGRNLRKAGKIDAALGAYRTSFDLAGRSEGDRPSFDDSRQPRRYTFRHEALLEWVARDMAGSGTWTHEQWIQVLPPFAVAPLAASRAIQAGDRAEADRLIDAAVAGSQEPSGGGFSEAEHRAAGAEALAVRSRWTDAAEQYRRAIELVSDDTTRRMWWVNLAEVAGRSGDDTARVEALDHATSLDEIPDEITKRAQKARDLAGLGRTSPRP